VKQFRGAWPVAGVVAGAAGLATSYFIAGAMSVRTAPVTAVADLVVRLTPGSVAESLIGQVGHADKPLVLTGILVVSALLFAWAGSLSRRSWAPALVFLGLAVVAGIGVALERGSSTSDYVPIAVGFVTWLVALSLLTEPLRAVAPTAVPVGAGGSVDLLEPAPDQSAGHSRRAFLVRSSIIVIGAALVAGAGRVVGAGRRQVEQARSALRLPQVTKPVIPDGAQIGLDGIVSWEVPAADFYLIDTAFVKPSIEPANWKLRIHGAVDHEITLTYQELIDRKFTEDWITLNCVSNPVGGDLVGNAWFSGVRLADILAEAGPQAGADAVLQTSDDGWTCGTPLAALTDDRNAMLAVAMNGEPLRVEHGFPVRTVVPGLYGYVSACKWVVDMEVTKFSKISAFWTERGWGEMGPVKIASRVDVPRSGEEVDAGDVDFGGVAWMQHTGISGVEFSVDGGAWQKAEIGAAAGIDSWVQWRGQASVDSGDHKVTVRAIDADGNVQTSAVVDVLPDGATGLQTQHFTAS